MAARTFIPVDAFEKFNRIYSNPENLLKLKCQLADCIQAAIDAGRNIEDEILQPLLSYYLFDQIILATELQR